jgi:hypothetical protein
LIVVHGMSAQPQYGTGADKRWAWSGGGVNVFIDALTNPVPPRRVNPFLRSYLPATHGGRIITRLGLRAATETVPCSTPAGSCAGTIESLVILDDTTVYDVFVGNSDPSVTSAVVDSFRLIN